MSAEKASGTKSSKRASVTDALERVAAELDAVSESELVHINVDVTAAVATALGILPNLEKLKDDIKTLPVDHQQIAKFEAYTLALYDAHADFLSASRPQEELPELVEKGTALRDRLYGDVQALVGRGLANGEEIREVRTNTGYKALAMDLKLLGDALQRRWKEIQGKTAVQLEEVLETQQLSEQLMRAIGERQHAPTVVADAVAQRSRVYTLFFAAYDEVRRAVSFLRWEQGDVDEIIPSLYQGRGGPRRKEEAAPPATPPVVAAPTVPTPEDPKTPVVTTNGPVGSPNSSPFVS